MGGSLLSLAHLFRLPSQPCSRALPASPSLPPPGRGPDSEAGASPTAPLNDHPEHLTKPPLTPTNPSPAAPLDRDAWEIQSNLLLRQRPINLISFNRWPIPSPRQASPLHKENPQDPPITYDIEAKKFFTIISNSGNHLHQIVAHPSPLPFDFQLDPPAADLLLAPSSTEAVQHPPPHPAWSKVPDPIFAMGDQARRPDAPVARTRSTLAASTARPNLFRGQLTRRPTATSSNSADTLRLDVDVLSDSSEIVVRNQQGEIELGDPPSPMPEEQDDKSEDKDEPEESPSSPPPSHSPLHTPFPCTLS